jgi:hypothetical protein
MPVCERQRGRAVLPRQGPAQVLEGPAWSVLAGAVGGQWRLTQGSARVWEEKWPSALNWGAVLHWHSVHSRAAVGTALLADAAVSSRAFRGGNLRPLKSSGPAFPRRQCRPSARTSVDRPPAQTPPGQPESFYTRATALVPRARSPPRRAPSAHRPPLQMAETAQASPPVYRLWSSPAPYHPISGWPRAKRDSAANWTA